MNVEIEMDRQEAERHPCPYVLPARSRKGEPLRCAAEVGEPCRNPLTGQPLRHQAAHHPRLVLAGRAAASTVGDRRPSERVVLPRRDDPDPL